MSKSQLALTVSILDREYRVACEEHEKAALRDSAELLDQRMREIRDSGRVVGLERVAIMAALNLAREVVDTRTAQSEEDKQLSLKLNHMRDLLDEADQQGVE